MKTWGRRALVTQVLRRFMRATDHTLQGRTLLVRDMINTTWAGRMP